MIRRLRFRDDFLALRRDGRTVRRGPLEVRFRAFDGDQRNSHGCEPRVAYAISRAVGGAVVRNRIRRRLRVLMTDLLDRVDGPPGGDFLVRVLPAAASCDHATLGHHLAAAVGEFSSEEIR
ncbi:MAG: ribonuclease P protein component [Acidimicrobiales bacterium]|nr:ribonuclease P protein component [Acidimicrobiales bacterium]